MAKKKITKLILDISPGLELQSLEPEVRISVDEMNDGNITLTTATKTTAKKCENGHVILTMHEPKSTVDDDLECIGYQFECAGNCWLDIDGLRIDRLAVFKTTVVFEDGSEEVEYPTDGIEYSPSVTMTGGEPSIMQTQIDTGRGDTWVVIPDECFVPRG